MAIVDVYVGSRINNARVLSREEWEMPVGTVRESAGTAAERQKIAQACQAVESAVSQINEFYEQIFASQHEAIAKLSVEIARKILAKQISEGDYSIESIVAEALSTAGQRQGLTVRLNPDDLGSIESSGTKPEGVTFTGDRQVGRGECIVDTGTGQIRAMIDEQLEKIRAALSQGE